MAMTTHAEHIWEDAQEFMGNEHINTLIKYVPDYMQEGMLNYLIHGIEPGSFLCAVLRNDLRTACELADNTNRFRLWEYVCFLYNAAPVGSWGSPENFMGWLAKKGLKGLAESRTTEGEISA